MGGFSFMNQVIMRGAVLDPCSGTYERYQLDFASHMAEIGIYVVMLLSTHFNHSRIC